MQLCYCNVLKTKVQNAKLKIYRIYVNKFLFRDSIVTSECALTFVAILSSVTE